MAHTKVGSYVSHQRFIHALPDSLLDVIQSIDATDSVLQTANKTKQTKKSVALSSRTIPTDRPQLVDEI
jgi:hypothetical protein